MKYVACRSTLTKLSIFTGNCSLWWVYDTWDLQILRMDIGHDHGKDRGTPRVPGQVPHVARCRQTGEAAQRWAAEEGVFGGYTPPRARVAHLGWANGRRRSAAQAEHMGSPCRHYEARKDHCHHHDTLYRWDAAGTSGRFEGFVDLNVWDEVFCNRILFESLSISNIIMLRQIGIHWDYYY